MATGNLIKKKEEFELWLKSQIAKGCDLLKREVAKMTQPLCATERLLK